MCHDGASVTGSPNFYFDFFVESVYIMYLKHNLGLSLHFKIFIMSR